jgi:hypothetical protein
MLLIFVFALIFVKGNQVIQINMGVNNVVFFKGRNNSMEINNLNKDLKNLRSHLEYNY